MREGLGGCRASFRGIRFLRFRHHVVAMAKYVFDKNHMCFSIGVSFHSFEQAFPRPSERLRGTRGGLHQGPSEERGVRGLCGCGLPRGWVRVHIEAV